MRGGGQPKERCQRKKDVSEISQASHRCLNGKKCSIKVFLLLALYIYSCGKGGHQYLHQIKFVLRFAFIATLAVRSRRAVRIFRESLPARPVDSAPDRAGLYRSYRLMILPQSR
jgi:hypothetical protein